MLYHFNLDYSYGFGSNGYLGVEFFFVISGFFMAKNAFENNEMNNIGIQTRNYIFHKIKKIYIYYLVALMLSILYRILAPNFNLKDLLRGLLNSLPSYIFIDMAVYGFGASIDVGNQWFLSVLFLCQLFIYPIVRKKKEVATCIIFPLIGIFGLGFLYKHYQSISAVAVKDLVVYPGIIRGMSEISLGGMLYSVVGEIQKIKFTKFAKIFLSVMKYLLLISIIVFIIGNYSSSLNIGVFILLLIFVMLVLCDDVYRAKGQFFTLLGSWSMSLFLFHMPIKIYLLRFIGTDLQPVEKIFVFCVDFAGCIAIHYVTKGIIVILPFIKDFFISNEENNNVKIQ